MQLEIVESYSREEEFKNLVLKKSGFIRQIPMPDCATLSEENLPVRKRIVEPKKIDEKK